MTDGTPLAQRLGLKRGMRCWFHNLPTELATRIDAEAHGLEVQPTASDGLQCVLLFATDPATLGDEVAALTPLMAQGGLIWIAWPRGTADVADAAQASALANNLVAAESLAIEDRWSAVRLAVAKDPR